MLSWVEHEKSFKTSVSAACFLHVGMITKLEMKLRTSFVHHFKNKYLHFNESLDFLTVHSLMNYTNLIESCQAHLPMQCASSIELICQK